MKYLLDTDILVAFLRGIPTVVKRILETPSIQLGISSINLAELYYGANKSQLVSLRIDQIDQLSQLIKVFSIKKTSAEIFGRVKANLEKLGKRLDDADLWIASVALEHKLILVSHNIKHFGRIPNLQLEDWLI